MVVIERSSSQSSSASSRKEKQSKSCEKDLKGKLVRNTSSSSSPSTPSKKGKQSVSCLKDNSDHHGILEGKLTRKASSGSITSSPSTPSKKGKRSGSCLKENHEEMLKGKLTRKASTLSSPSSPSTRKGKQSVSSQKDGKNELDKEKPVRKASLLSSSSRSPTKKDQRGLSNGTEKIRKSNSLIKSRMKELGPICNKRKEYLNSIKLDEDIDVYLDKQIDEGGKINPNDCMWLSSGSMTPQEFGLFMSALDPGLDEWVMSFLPKSSRTPKADGSKTPVCEANLSGGTEEAGVVCEANESLHARTQSTDSSSSLDMSTHADSSTFWNMDRTGVWVSLINLDGEDSEFISNVNAKLDDLESNFPSPSFEVNWDSYSSDIGVSSSGKSTQESGSQSEWSSDLLSDSMDWEVDSDDPIYWPYGVDCDWDQKDSGSFTISPRKGVYKIRFKSGEDDCETPDSIRFRLHGRNGKKILFLSGLSASKIIEFKKGCRKNAAATAGSPRGKRFSKTGKRASRFRKRVPPILENDLEGISPKDTPKESVKKGNNSSEMDLSECADIWGDELDSNSPLFWPTDQKSDWNDTWDSFDVSPRKSTDSSTSLRPSSPKNGFAVSNSIRLKFLPKKMKIKSGLNSSKSPKFKSASQKINTALSGKRLRVVVPRKGRSMFKSNKNYMSFKHGRSHGKKKRDLPPKAGKSVKEFIRLVSILGLHKMFPGNEVTSEELPIETLLGLNEFDGNEGFDMEFEDAELSLMECEGG